MDISTLSNDSTAKCTGSAHTLTFVHLTSKTYFLNPLPHRVHGTRRHRPQRHQKTKQIKQAASSWRTGVNSRSEKSTTMRSQILVYSTKRKKNNVQDKSIFLLTPIFIFIDASVHMFPVNKTGRQQRGRRNQLRANLKKNRQTLCRVRRDL